MKYISVLEKILVSLNLIVIELTLTILNGE